jgi:hypothetical protein
MLFVGQVSNSRRVLDVRCTRHRIRSYCTCDASGVECVKLGMFFASGIEFVVCASRVKFVIVEFFAYRYDRI